MLRHCKLCSTFVLLIICVLNFLTLPFTRGNCFLNKSESTEVFYTYESIIKLSGKKKNLNKKSRTKRKNSEKIDFIGPI